MIRTRARALATPGRLPVSVVNEFAVDEDRPPLGHDGGPLRHARDRLACSYHSAYARHQAGAP